MGGQMLTNERWDKLWPTIGGEILTRDEGEQILTKDRGGQTVSTIGETISDQK